MAVNGDTVVRWIDSKGSCPLPGLGFASALAKLRGQLARFVELERIAGLCGEVLAEVRAASQLQRNCHQDIAALWH